jgi:1-acyl-sn-glycerol-3-phosphate acyltransferase
MRYEGLENIPRDSGYILASNHITALDPLFIAAKVPGQLHFLAKTELFKNKLIGWILRHVNAIEIRRGAGDDEPLEEAKRRIERGGVFAIFVEGTRSKDGKPGRARSGVALMSGRTGADILPCAVVYDKKLRFRSPVTVRYGRLLKSGELGIDTASPATMRQAAKTVMAGIVSLFENGVPAGGGEVAG